MSQTILDALANVEKASQEQTAASQAIVQEVAGKMKEIDDNADEVLNRVDNAIPTAVNSEMYQNRYLDPENGDDSNNGFSSGSAFKTLKALINAAPVGSTICVRGSHDTVIEVNEALNIVNKHVVIFMNSCTLNINAQITMYGGSFKNYYSFVAINQSTKFAFLHFSADIRIAGTVNPIGDAVCLFRQTYTSGSVSHPGSHHSNVFYQGTVNDAQSQYYVFSPTYYKASMVVVTYALTLGANVGLFDPVYDTVQVGAKGVYLVGA